MLMKGLLRYFQLFLLLLCNVPAPAQHWRAGISLAGGASYTGLNAYLLPELSWKKHQVYIGPKLALSTSYLPRNNTWGYNAGYRFLVFEKARWSSLVDADYQVVYYKPYNPLGYPVDKNNCIREFQFALTLGYRLHPDLSLRVNLGTGLYAERFYDVTEGRKNMQYGMTQLARISACYQLFRR